MPSRWTSRIECGGHPTSGSVHPHLALSGDYFALCHGLCALRCLRGRRDARVDYDVGDCRGEGRAVMGHHREK